MKEIAKLILKMFESTKPDIQDPEGFDKLNVDFFSGLSDKQKDMFLCLETMYLEIMDRKLLALLEFVLNLSVEE